VFVLEHYFAVNSCAAVGKAFIVSNKYPGEPRSSVSTVSSYGMEDRAIEVRSPAEAK
jgi:hypothetical protein